MKKSRINLIFVLLVLVLTVLFVYFVEYKTEPKLNSPTNEMTQTLNITSSSVICGLLLILSIPTYFIIKKKTKD